MASSGRPQSPQRLIVRERIKESLELRKSGWSYQEIADHFSVTKKTAHDYVKRALKQLNEECNEIAADVRKIEEERLTKWQKCLETKINNGDTAAIQVAIKIAERRSRLYGLDPTAKTTIEIQAANPDALKNIKEQLNAKLAELNLTPKQAEPDQQPLQ
jgi:predicted DNA-binding protein YlxM (UPF0122 family)